MPDYDKTALNCTWMILGGYYPHKIYDSTDDLLKRLGKYAPSNTDYGKMAEKIFNDKK